VSERKDVLYSLFFILSLIFYLRYDEKHQLKDYLLTASMFLLAVLSKSAAVVLPLLLLLIDFLKERRLTTKLVLEKLPFLLVSAVFGVIAIRSQQAAIGSDVIKGVAGVPQFLFATYGLMKYIFMLFIPTGLSAIHPYPATVEGTTRMLIYASPAVFVFLAGLVIWSLKFSRQIAFGFGFSIVNLLLVIQVIPVGEAYMAERYTYMAYFGLLYILVHLANSVRKKTQNIGLSKYYWAVSIFFVLAFTVITRQRTAVWKDALSLYEDIAAKYPQKAYMVYYLKGLDKHDKGDLEGAVADYSEAARLHPNYSRPFNNRGNIYFYKGMYKEALADFNQALSLDPGVFETWNNRGNAKAMLSDLPGALGDYEKSLNLKPDYGEAYKNRGLVKMMQGDTAAAVSDWKSAIRFGAKGAASMLEQLGR
jgi:Flp pilus assembly protein TadD